MLAKLPGLQPLFRRFRLTPERFQAVALVAVGNIALLVPAPEVNTACQDAHGVGMFARYGHVGLAEIEESAYIVRVSGEFLLQQACVASILVGLTPAVPNICDDRVLKRRRRPIVAAPVFVRGPDTTPGLGCPEKASVLINEIAVPLGNLCPAAIRPLECQFHM